IGRNKCFREDDDLGAAGGSLCDQVDHLLDRCLPIEVGGSRLYRGDLHAATHTRIIAASALASVLMRLRHCLANRHGDAHVTKGFRTVASVATFAAGDVCPALGAPKAGGLLFNSLPFSHVEASCAACDSCAARSASSRKTSPTNLPSEVVMGALGSSCSDMTFASSVASTNGRNVLGPGRITSSIFLSGSPPSSFSRSKPSTTRSRLTTTHALRPA